MLWPVVMEVSTISFVVTYVSELPPYLLYNKEILSTHTHTQSTCYTTHECFQTLCCYSPQCAKIEKKCNLETCNILVFWIFFRTLLKKTYSRNVYFKFFLALRQKQYTRLCFPKFTFLFLCLSSLCSAAAVGGGALLDKCVEGHFRKTVKFGS